MSSINVVTKEKVHPLSRKQVGFRELKYLPGASNSDGSTGRFETKWEAWLRDWNEEENPRALLGLLHRLLDSFHENKAVIFLLELADGHLDITNFIPESDCVTDWHSRGEMALEEMSPCKVKQAISRKAFEELANGFFKNPNREIPRWAERVLVPEVLEKLLWFFRMNENETRPSFVNLQLCGQRTNHDDVAIKFVEEFWKFILHPGKCGFYRTHSSSGGWLDKTEESLGKMRHRLVPIICALGQVNHLWDFKPHHPFLQPGSLFLKELNRIALIGGYDFEGEKRIVLRPPKNLAEAAAKGSQEARFLILLNSKIEVEKNEETIRTARDQKEETEEVLRQALQKR